MQVDGEACKLMPSIITIGLLNKATMLSKRKGGKPNVTQTALDNLKIDVHRISMTDYEQYHYDKNLLSQAGNVASYQPVDSFVKLVCVAINIGKLEVNPTSDLEQIRDLVNRLLNNYKDLPKLSDWCFLDCKLLFL